MPAPMPLEPPVTRATLPLNDFACICHQNSLSQLLYPFWIILSRMVVQRAVFRDARLDRFSCRFGSCSEFTDNVKRLTSRHPDCRLFGNNVGSAPRTATSIPGSPSSVRHRRAPQQNLPQRRTPDGLVALRQIPTKLRYS